MAGPNHCIILKDGLEVKHNVNRLLKQQRWDDIKGDTTTAFAKPSAPIILEPSAEKSAKKPVRVGEIVVFPMNMKKDHTLPFGVGRIMLTDNTNDLKFQWMGNVNNSARGGFLP